MPIGLSLNRYKSDSIPRSFFEVALNDDFKRNFKVFEKEILKLLKNDDYSNAYFSISEGPQS